MDSVKRESQRRYSLDEYFAFEDVPLVEMFRVVNKGEWESRGCDNVDQIARLESIDVSLPLKEIYRLVFP